MKANRLLLGTLGLGWLLATQAGCQTWVAGMTLPSGHYLEHPPQYFPPSPPFPLPRELAQQQATAAAGVPGGPPAPVMPLPVVPPPLPGGAPPAPAPGVGGAAPVP
jgi:hypothetical protein